MKRYLFSSLFLFFSIMLIGQEVVWPVLAVDKKKSYPVKALFADGTSSPVNAIVKEGDDHFMDVKVIRNGEVIPVKLIVSNEYYVPVKAVLPDGTLIDIKADAKNEGVLDVKGVRRDGNTVIVAAINAEESYYYLKAISPDGKSEREVRGVKFVTSNEEMKIGSVKIQAHVKAIPVVDTDKVDRKWSVKGMNVNGEDMDIVAVNIKGVEFPIIAKMSGTTPCVLDVRAQSSSLDIMVKLIKEEDLTYVAGIDDYNRPYEVKAKDDNGTYYDLVGTKRVGNLIDIMVALPDGTQLPIKAISSEEHYFDIKGVKLSDEEIEGTFYGEENILHYFAHIKAIASLEEVPR